MIFWYVCTHCNSAPKNLASCTFQLVSYTSQYSFHRSRTHESFLVRTVLYLEQPTVGVTLYRCTFPVTPVLPHTTTCVSRCTLTLYLQANFLLLLSVSALGQSHNISNSIPPKLNRAPLESLRSHFPLWAIVIMPIIGFHLNPVVLRILQKNISHFSQKNKPTQNTQHPRNTHKHVTLTSPPIRSKESTFHLIHLCLIQSHVEIARI